MSSKSRGGDVLITECIVLTSVEKGSSIKTITTLTFGKSSG